MEMESGFSPLVFRQLNQVGMVGKEQNLRTLAEITECREGSQGSFIIEVDKQVVKDQRHRLVIREVEFEAGQAEREIKLIPGAFAHSTNGNGSPRTVPAPLPGNHRLVPIVIAGDDTGKCLAGDFLKPMTGFLHEWSLVLLTEAVDPAFQ